MAHNAKKTARMPAMKFAKLQKRIRAARVPAAKKRMFNKTVSGQFKTRSPSARG